MSEPSSESSPSAEGRLEQFKQAEARLNEMKARVDLAAQKLGLPDNRKVDLMAIMYGGITEKGDKPNDSNQDKPQAGTPEFIEASRNLIRGIKSKGELETALLGLPSERKFDVINALDTKYDVPPTNVDQG